MKLGKEFWVSNASRSTIRNLECTVLKSDHVPHGIVRGNVLVAVYISILSTHDRALQYRVALSIDPRCVCVSQATIFADERNENVQLHATFLASRRTNLDRWGCSIVRAVPLEASVFHAERLIGIASSLM